MKQNLISKFAQSVRPKAAPPQQLASLSKYARTLGSPDPVVQNQGLDEYWRMTYDDEVSSCLKKAITISLPGVSFQPADDSDEAKRMADFVQAVNLHMQGSMTETYQAILLNAFVTGFSVVEPIWQTIDLGGDFGLAVGLRALYVRPSNSFIPNGIQVDEAGEITGFKQSTEYGGGTCSLDDVVYYAHQGGPNNRYGISLLKPARNPFRAKEKVFELYPVFLTTNASGIRHASIPDEDFEDDTIREEAFTALKRIGPLPSFVTAKSWELKVDLPGSGVGSHFKDSLVYFDERIRTALLGDSAFSSQAGEQGAKASREVSQDNVVTHYTAIGHSFAESITEQLNTLILAVNRLTGPVPRTMPQPVMSDDESQAMAFDSLSTMKTAGLLTIALPEKVQLEIVKKKLASAGITIDSVEPAASTTPETKPPKESPKEPSGNPNDQAGMQAQARGRKAQLRAASAARVHAAKAQQADLQNLVEKVALELGSTWAAVAQGVTDQLAAGMADLSAAGGGNWKTTNLTELRQIIVERVRYHSAKVRQVLTKGMEDAYTGGTKDAQALLPVHAVRIGIAPKGWSPSQAKQVVQNRIMLLIDEKYGKLASAIYYQVENAVLGDLAPRTAIASVGALIEGFDFGASRAMTIVETACATAWNAARMHSFGEFENADGTGDTDIIAYEFVNLNDDKTTPSCKNANEGGLGGLVIRCDDPNLPRPPLHYNCRSQLNPIFGYERAQVEIMDEAEVAALVAQLKADGYIQEGFGGV